MNNFLVDYEYFSVHGKRRHKQGRTPGGIVTFIKRDIPHGIKLIKACDYGLFFKLDKDVFGWEQSVILCCVYIPPDGSTFYDNRPERDGITELESHLVTLVSDNNDSDIFMMGDFNARTSDDADYILDDTVTHLPVEEWYTADTFNLPRHSRDRNVQSNVFGRSLLDMCRIFGIHMLNGRFPGDDNGEYTFSAKSGSSVVDYMLASSSLFTVVTKFWIDPMTESDHFPLVGELMCNMVTYGPLDDQSAVRPFSHYKWNAAKRDGFLETLTDERSMRLIEQSMQALDLNDVNNSVGVLVDVLQRAASEMRCVPRTKNVHPGTSRHSADWWDDEKISPGCCIFFAEQDHEGI
jgi:exonuclease III